VIATFNGLKYTFFFILYFFIVVYVLREYTYAKCIMSSVVTVIEINLSLIINIATTDTSFLEIEKLSPYCTYTLNVNLSRFK
jgi:hypothetical protein